MNLKNVKPSEEGFGRSKAKVMSAVSQPEEQAAIVTKIFAWQSHDLFLSTEIKEPSKILFY